MVAKVLFQPVVMKSPTRPKMRKNNEKVQEYLSDWTKMMTMKRNLWCCCALRLVERSPTHFEQAEEACARKWNPSLTKITIALPY